MFFKFISVDQKLCCLYLFTLFLQVVFEGVRGNGWQGDIAIDEIKIVNCGGGGEGGEEEGGGGGEGGQGGGGGGGIGKLLNCTHNKYQILVKCHTTPLSLSCYCRTGK